MGRYMTNLLRAANTHLASHTKSHTDGLGRKGLVQEPNAFYLSTLETHETQAMLNDGTESTLLLELVFLPLAVLVIIAIAMMVCRCTGSCCFKIDHNETYNREIERKYKTPKKVKAKKTKQPQSTTDETCCSPKKRTTSVTTDSSRPRKSNTKLAHRDTVMVRKLKQGNATARATSREERDLESSVVVGQPPARHTTPDTAISAFERNATTVATPKPTPEPTPEPIPNRLVEQNISDISASDNNSSSAAEEAKWDEDVMLEVKEDDIELEDASIESSGHKERVKVDKHQQLVDSVFLDNVNLNSPYFPLPIDKLKIFILDLYSEFDADDDGHIDHFELKSFFRAVDSRGKLQNAHPLTDSEISEVLDAFDDDRNGTLERSEFCTWILSGLSRSPEERAAFANTKPLAKKLNSFLNGISAYIKVEERKQQRKAKDAKEEQEDRRDQNGKISRPQSRQNLINKSPVTKTGEIPISNATETILEGHKHWVESVCVSSSGRYVFSGGVDAKIRMWDITSGKSVRKLAGHKNVVTSLCCPPKNTAYHVVSGSVDKSVRLWNVTTGKCVGKLKGHQKGVTSVSVSPINPQIVCSGSIDTSAAIWDARANKRVRKLMGHTESVDACSISNDGELLCSAGADGVMRIWELSTGQCINVLRGSTKGWIYSVNFSPTQRNILSVGTHQHNVEIWDVSGTTGGVLLNTLIGHRDAVMSVHFSPDGKRIVSGSMDTDLRIWETSTGTNLSCLKGHDNLVSSVSFMPDNERIASGSRDQMVRIWKP